MYSRILIGLLLILLSSVSSAEPVNNQNDSAVIVTATRTAQTTDETLASVSVITRENIEQSQAKDLLDLFRTYSSIDMTREGGPGSNTSLFMRGANSNHTLVLIDGVRAASATTGAFAWAHMPLSQIERIEIVRGPRASLYGSDAIGGVIQIFTRKPKGMSVALEAGTYGTENIEAGWGYRGNIDFNVNVSSRKTDGFSAQNRNGFSFDPDDDGYENDSITLAARLPLPAKHSLNINTWYSEGKTEFDIGDSENINQTINLDLKGSLTNFWTHSLKTSYATDNLDTNSANPSLIITRRQMTEWQHDLSIGENNIVIFGLSYIQDKGKNIDTGINATQFDEEVDNKAAFISWQSQFMGNDLQLSGRSDKHDTFGKHDTGQIVIGRDVIENTRVWAAYGSAFRAPNINDLFHPGFGGSFAGNPDLRPEQSITTEVGLKLAGDTGQRLNITLFQTRIEDLIAFEGLNAQAINIDQSTTRGVEIEYSLRTKLWSSRTQVTAQQARNDEDSSELLRRPDQKLSFILDRKMGSGSIGTDIIMVSERADFGTRLPGYGIANIRYMRPLNKNLSLEAKAENITDKKYELVSGYNTPGRSYYLTLRYAQN